MANLEKSFIAAHKIAIRLHQTFYLLEIRRQQSAFLRPGIAQHR